MVAVVEVVGGEGVLVIRKSSSAARWVIISESHVSNTTSGIDGSVGVGG